MGIGVLEYRLDRSQGLAERARAADAILPRGQNVPTDGYAPADDPSHTPADPAVHGARRADGSTDGS